MIKVKKTMKNFWQDNSGLSISMETVGLQLPRIKRLVFPVTCRALKLTAQPMVPSEQVPPVQMPL